MLPISRLVSSKNWLFFTRNPKFKQPLKGVTCNVSTQFATNFSEELPEVVNTAQRTYIVRMVGLDNVPVGLPSNEVALVVFRAAVPS